MHRLVLATTGSIMGAAGVAVGAMAVTDFVAGLLLQRGSTIQIGMTLMSATVAAVLGCVLAVYNLGALTVRTQRIVLTAGLAVGSLFSLYQAFLREDILTLTRIGYVVLMTGIALCACHFLPKERLA